MRKLHIIALFLPLVSSCLSPYIINRPFENTWYGNPELKKFTFREHKNYPRLDTLLNVDGYYWGEVKDTADTTILALLLYRDGSIATYAYDNYIQDTVWQNKQKNKWYMGNTSTKDTSVADIQKDIEDVLMKTSNNAYIVNWGRFYLYEDTIRGQELYVFGGGLGHLIPYEYFIIENKFLIINREQIVILRARNPAGHTFNYCDTLNFVPYKNRPDSTFFFKEKRWFNKFNLFYTKKMREIKAF